MNYRFVWPEAPKNLKILLYVYVGMFVLNIFSEALGIFSTAQVWGLSWSQLIQGKLWTPLFYWLYSLDLFETLFNGLLFWFLGAELVALWGRRFWIMTALTVLGGAAAYLIMDSLLGPLGMIAGPHGLTLAIILIYGLMYPERDLYLLFFPVKGKIFTLVLLGMELYRFLFAASKLQYLGHLAGTLIAVTYWYFFLRNGGGDTLSRIFAPRKRGRLSLVKQNDDKPPRYYQ